MFGFVKSVLRTLGLLEEEKQPQREGRKTAPPEDDTETTDFGPVMNYDEFWNEILNGAGDFPPPSPPSPTQSLQERLKMSFDPPPSPTGALQEQFRQKFDSPETLKQHQILHSAQAPVTASTRAQEIQKEIEHSLRPLPEPFQKQPARRADLPKVSLDFATESARRTYTQSNIASPVPVSTVVPQPRQLGAHHALFESLSTSQPTTWLARRVRVIMEAESGSLPYQSKPNPLLRDSKDPVARYVRSSLMVALPSRRFERPDPPEVKFLTESSTQTLRLPITPPNIPRTTLNKGIYDGLDLDPTSIRLLELKKGTSEIIQTRLHKFTFKEISQRHKYDALSYTWGDPEPTRPILVSEAEFSIGLNLFDALMSLRDPEEDRFLWVDAICINQQSPPEKTWELPKMGKVYETADTVRIYLGRESIAPSISVLFNFLNRPNETEFTDDNTEEDRASEFRNAGVDRLKACEGLVEFSRRDWWARVWVLQEFYFASREPVWHWGGKSACNSLLKRDLGMLRKSVSDIALLQGSPIQELLNKSLPPRKYPPYPRPPFKTEIARISHLISRRYKPGQYENPKLRYRELFAGCKEAQDLIYGLIGLFEPAFGEVFVDDYMMDPELLWASLLVYLVKFYDWGDILWWYPHRLLHEATLPSWLPDLRHRTIPSDREIKPNDDDIEGESLPVIKFENWILYAEGITLGTIETVVNIPEDDDPGILRELYRFDQGSMFGVPSLNSAGIRHPNRRILDWTAESEASGDLSLSVFQQDSLIHLVDSILQDPTNNQPLTPSEHSVNASLNSPYPINRWDVKRLLKIIMADFIVASISDCENFVATLVHTSKNLWMNRRNAHNHATPAFWMEPLISDLGPFLDRFGRRRGIKKGHVTRYANILRGMVMFCDHEYEFHQLCRALEVMATTFRNLSCGFLTGGEHEGSEPYGEVGEQLGKLRGLVGQFRGRSLFVTNNGFRGLSSPGVQGITSGDTVILLDGISFPLVIRMMDDRPDTHKAKMIGCALVDGVDMKKGKRWKTAELPDGFIVDGGENFELI